MLSESEKKHALNDKDQLIDVKLSHVKNTDAEMVKVIIKNHREVIATSFEDGRPSKVSVMSDNQLDDMRRSAVFTTIDAI